MLLPLAALAGSLRAGYHGHFPPGWNVSRNPLPLSQAPTLTTPTPYRRPRRCWPVLA